MPNRRHSSRRFTPSCSNNITNSCRCDMIDCSDHGTPAPPPQANNADTMRQPCPRTPVHYLSHPYRRAERGKNGGNTATTRNACMSERFRGSDDNPETEFILG